MHWQEVEGLPLPHLLGGHPALDFCNTWAGWGQAPDPRGEWLKSYDHLAVWSMHAGLVSSDDVRRLRRAARRDPSRARGVLTDARTLRAATHAAALDPTQTRSVAVITSHVRRSGSAVRITPGQPPHWTIPSDTGLDLPLLAVAWSVGDLLTRADLHRVRACPGRDCGWLFLDTTGRRRWCSMSTCGNRAKVNAFARRRRPQ